MSSTALACSCAYGGYWVSDFVKDKIIFEGRADKTEWLGKRQTRRPRGYNTRTSFQITNPLWNTSTSKISLVHSSEDGGSCGMNFSMGIETLVVAHSFEDHLFRTSTCTLNAVDEITLFNYFEKNIDVYIPSLHECSETQIQNPKDAKNCYYWSRKAEQERSIEASKRRSAIWKSKREVKKALTLSNETP